MVGVAQQVEHRVVIPVVAGSSPVTHPDIVLPDALMTAVGGVRSLDPRPVTAPITQRHLAVAVLWEIAPVATLIRERQGTSGC